MIAVCLFFYSFFVTALDERIVSQYPTRVHDSMHASFFPISVLVRVVSDLNDDVNNS